MKTTLLAMTSLVVAITAACMGGGPVDVSEAEGLLAANDLPGASAAWGQLASANPDSPDVLLGVAYDQLLAGNWDAADATLARAQEITGDADGSIRLRRALVALQSGETDRLDQVRSFGQDSGQPLGKLLAAEVRLVDVQVDEALPLLKEVRTTPGAVGATAEQYLSLLESGSVFKVGLAENSALWALGLRDVACEGAEEVLKALADDDPEKATLLLLWAGRAATSGRPGISLTLLDEVSVLGPPEGQEWRLQATRALALAADGQTQAATDIFDALQAASADGMVPYEGLMDARATAAGLASSPADARSLAGPVESVAAARGLYQAGAGRVARDAAPNASVFATFLEGR